MTRQCPFFQYFRVFYIHCTVFPVDGVYMACFKPFNQYLNSGPKPLDIEVNFLSGFLLGKSIATD